jgi:hypothetical protein
MVQKYRERNEDGGCGDALARKLGNYLEKVRGTIAILPPSHNWQSETVSGLSTARLSRWRGAHIDNSGAIGDRAVCKSSRALAARDLTNRSSTSCS